jgi:hypothetical protein
MKKEGSAISALAPAGHAAASASGAEEGMGGRAGAGSTSMSRSEAAVTATEMTTAKMLAGEGGRAGQGWAQVAALVIADEFTSHDLSVRNPAWEGAQHLAVTNVPGTLCHVSVAADGLVEWELWPCEGRRADPACTAMMVLGILGAGVANVALVPATSFRCAVSFKGAAGRILAGHGMRVVVRADPDQDVFEVYSDIEVTNPVRPERGTVRVADDGSLTWRCRARTTPEDNGALDPAQLAGIIARAVTGMDHPGARPPFVQALAPSGD